jgi:hypothetical protein
MPQTRPYCRPAAQAGELALRLVAIMGALALMGAPALAQQVVQPNAPVTIQQQQAPKREIAPEFRAEAERRALERQKLALCQQKMLNDKILVRYRTAYLIACIDAK